MGIACSDATPEALATRGDSGPHITREPPPRLDTRAQRSDILGQQRHSAIVTAAARVAPAVVSVNVVRRERRTARGAFDFFFLPRPYERLVQGLGSGFLVSPDGTVITNQHVTANAEEIVVTTSDGVDHEAELLGEDPLTDIAVLKIDADGLPTAAIGRSTDLMIGEWVVAIGNPYGYLLGNTEPSVTAGVVSALGRNLLPSGDEGTIYVRMIQTDAAINPGNSGGPLVNTLGEVVGVNSSIFSESGGSVGVGFAIPIERAVRVAEELKRYGEVRRAWVGLSVAGADRLRDWKKSGGLEVIDVAPGGPADRVGIRRGDVLVSADGYGLRTFLDWEAVKLDVGPGDSLSITYSRGGRERTAVVVVQDLPTSMAERISVLGQIELITVTPAVRQERGLRVDAGALVVAVEPQAQRVTGLAVGDVIVQINRRRIRSAEDVREAFSEARGGGAIRLYFVRGDARGFSDFRVR